MPFSVRTQLTIVCGLLLVVLLAAYTLITRAADSAEAFAQYQAGIEADARATAVALADSIREADKIEVLTNLAQNSTPDDPRPVATAALDALAERANHFIWLLDRRGRAFYTTRAVRLQLLPSEQTALDSIVGTVVPGTLRRLGNRSVVTSEAVNVSYPVIDRVVVAVPINPPPPAIRGSPILIVALMAPIIAILAVAGANLFTRIVQRPIERDVGKLVSDVEAITDGRSLHRRLASGEDSVEQVGQLAETLNAMIARLEQSFAGLRRFTADASHELKTPLTVLRADVERAMATQSDRREQLVALEEALAETTRMADLVDSLLTLARADEGRFDLHRVEVDLQDLAQDVFETALLLGEPAQVNVKMESPPALRVMGDRRRLRQLFLNLITNAIKYTPSGGNVELKLWVDEGTAKFSVRDSGIGIAASDLPHVFDRFWRADPARSRVGERGGFGLGLAISQYIAHAHGGSITVRSRLGRGSTFTVALPAFQRADAAAES